MGRRVCEYYTDKEAPICHKRKVVMIHYTGAENFLTRLLTISFSRTLLIPTGTIHPGLLKGITEFIQP